MADLSWAREAGADRRAALDRDAKTGATGARGLASAMFDGLIVHLWRRLGSGFKETVDAYNAGGRFSDLSFFADNERIIVERRHHPTFSVQLSLDRSARAILMTVGDEGQNAQTEPLEIVFVDQELLLWHDGQTENGYQLARRALKPRF
jgi:hypothetical protein